MKSDGYFLCIKAIVKSQEVAKKYQVHDKTIDNQANLLVYYSL